MIIEVGLIGLNGPWGMLALIAMAVAMLVNRAGASMVFFDVVGRFQAQRLIQDADTSMAVFNSIMLDTFANMQDSLNVIGTSFETLINEVLPMTEAMRDAEIELSKFLDASENVDAVTENVRSLGIQFGFTGDEALSAAAKMAQLASVLGPGQTGTGTQLGMEFGLISGMETEAAMQRLINLNQQLFFMTKGTEDLATAEEKGTKIRENTLDVMNQLNTIENRSASTMEQVTFVMNQFASQAHLTGESIAMMAAQSAVLIETGEEQGKAGRALRMIYARLGADTNGARKELEALNIAVLDSNDNLRPLSEILGDLSNDWSTISAAEKQAIAQTVAGNRHYTRFIKLMDNYERATQLAFEGQMGLFPAIEEVNKRLEDSITEYRAADAALSNYKATLGEELLPALTQAKERQGEFVEAMTSLVMISGKAGTGFVAMGINLKNIVVPLLGVVTNFAAMTVAIQANRAVTRAMAGEQLMLAEAFGASNAQKLRDLTMDKERTILAQALIPLYDRHRMQVQVLTTNEKRRAEISLKSALTRQNNTKGTITNLNTLVQTQKIAKLEAISNQNATTKGSTKYKEYAANIVVADNALDKLAVQLAKAQRSHDSASRSVEKHSMLLGGSMAKKTADSNAKIQEQNAARAQEARALYTSTGALFAMGTALQMLAPYEDARRAGMSMQIAATTIMTVKQLLLAKSEIASMIVRKQSIRLRNIEILGKRSEVGVTGVFITQKEVETGAILRNTAARRQNIVAGQVAAGGMVASTGAASGLAAALGGPVGIGVAIASVIAGYVLLGKAEKKRKKEMEALSKASTDYATTDVELFKQQIAEQTNTLDDFTEGAEAARLTLISLQAQQSDMSASDIAEKEQLIKTFDTLAQARRAQLLDTQDVSEKTIQAVLDAQAMIEPKEDRRTFTGRGLYASMDTMMHRTQKQVDDAQALVDDNILLADFISGLSDQSKEAVMLAIEAQAFGANTMAEEVNDASTVIANSLEGATQSMLDFNNAREELFFGMASSNITGDLVRQVVNRGVENLLVNTEVIMTNNFNGMTTEQAAQEILDHVERGARMRGVDMTTVSQSI